MANLQRIVYLSQEDYDDLITNNTITKNNKTLIYNANDLYITPEAVTVEKLNHTLTFGNGTYVYDGSADVTVPVYNGAY